MDPLARIAPPAAELLDRVDAVLARAGAPDGHPVWSLLRRLRTLPGEAIAAVATVTPAPLAATADTVRHLAGEYGRDALPAGSDWRGAGAERFAARWHAMRAHQDGLAELLHATASYLGALESWLAESRMALARTLADVLASAEAVQVCTAVNWSAGGPSDWSTNRVANWSIGGVADLSTGGASDRPGGLESLTRAAADIAARVLATLEAVHDNGERLRHEWAPRLAELTYHAPAADEHARFDTTTEVTL